MSQGRLDLLLMAVEVHNFVYHFIRLVHLCEFIPIRVETQKQMQTYFNSNSRALTVVVQSAQIAGLALGPHKVASVPAE